MVKALAAKKAGDSLELVDINLGPLAPDAVEIDVQSCGLCHSDLSMIHNDWGISQFPLISGHEVVGKVAAVGPQVTHIKVGQTVGMGWYTRTCLTCNQCLAGNHNLCGKGEASMIGRPGGFAQKVHAQAAWVTPLPQGVDPAKAGPLFCGGITVFNPMVQFDVKPTDRVGVVGIGGLGHFALQFLNKWGCEVYAFTSSDAKRDEVKRLGAHHAINSRDSSQLASVAGRLDFLIVTSNVTLDWNAYLAALAPKGRLHVVGAVMEPIPVPAMMLITGQRNVSGTPSGSPATIATMLEFCARHRIEAVTETFKLSRVNDAIAHLKEGKARYRIVLENDLT